MISEMYQGLPELNKEYLATKSPRTQLGLVRATADAQSGLTWQKCLHLSE